MLKLLVSASLGLAAGLTAAHTGHGFTGAHFHASDLFGPLALLAGVSTLLWWRRK